MSAGRLAALGVAATILIAASVWWIAGGVQSPTATPGQTFPSPTQLPTPVPTATVACRGETGALPVGLASDPCPSAIVAVELEVAPVRLPIERIVIEPGPFYCDVMWPGAGSSPPCYGPAVRPGQFMRAWVSFAKSEKVAVVALGLDIPDGIDEPGATRPPWKTNLLALEVPPAGWVMP